MRRLIRLVAAVILGAGLLASTVLTGTARADAPASLLKGRLLKPARNRRPRINDLDWIDRRRTTP